MNSRVLNKFFFVLILKFFFGFNVLFTQERPNVIIILVDDMGFSDIGSYGSEIQTPNLDFLSSNGLRFSNAYNTSKCFPSRAALLTGLYPHLIGYDKTHKIERMKNAITLGEFFKMANYTTLWSGKHHSIENPVTRGFDHFSGLLDGASNHFNPGLKRDGQGKPAQKRNDKNYDQSFRKWVIEGEIISPYTPGKNFYSTDEFTNYALNWISNQQYEEPFFLYLSYTAPHDPLMAWPEDIEKYKGKYDLGYEEIRKKRFEKQKQLGIISQKHVLTKPDYENWNSLSLEKRKSESKKMEVYAAMIDRIDQNIGKLINVLKSRNQLNNTLILFASDNGGSSEDAERPVNNVGKIGSLTNWTSLKKSWANVSNTPYKYYKNWIFEGGIKTPLIVFWPKKIRKTNSIIESHVHFIDFLPTFSEILELNYPKFYNGENIIPLSGESFWTKMTQTDNLKRKTPLFWKWRDGKAVRLGKWKLTSQDNNWQLYNLKRDPTEINDLVLLKPRLNKKLQELYEKWYKN